MYGKAVYGMVRYGMEAAAGRWWLLGGAGCWLMGFSPSVYAGSPAIQYVPGVLKSIRVRVLQSSTVRESLRKNVLCADEY
jgi:hypothetical protein